MANANAVKIRSTKKKKNGKPKYPRPTAANLSHNAAVNKANYWLNDGAKIVQSKSYESNHQVNADWIDWERLARERYLENENNLRAIKSNAILLEEGMIIIGTDVNASPENIKNIIEDFVAKFEKDNNTKVRHWSYHDHEGHEDEEGKEHINRHAHFIFDNVSNDGVMVRRNWKRDYFRQMQTDIFEVSKKYVPEIERGKESEYVEVEIEGRKVQVNTRKQIHHRVFRKMKENEQIGDLSNGFKDMMSQRDVLKKENTSIKGQNTKLKNANESLKFDKKELEKQLKTSSNELRIAMKEQGGFKREDYAILDQLKKDLEEKLKTKTLTEKELQEKFKDLEKSFLKEKNHLISIIEVKDIDIADLETKNKSLEALKIDLTSKVTALEAKEAHSPNMSDYEHLLAVKKNLKTNVTNFEDIHQAPKTGKLVSLMRWVETKFDEFKTIINNLTEVNKAQTIEIADLKEKLKTPTTKQQEESLDILGSLQSEAKRNLTTLGKSDSSLSKTEKEETTTAKTRRDR